MLSSITVPLTLCAASSELVDEMDELIEQLQPKAHTIPTLNMVTLIRALIHISYALSHLCACWIWP